MMLENRAKGVWSWTILDRSWKVDEVLQRSWIGQEDVRRDLQTYRRPRRSWIDQESMAWIIFNPWSSCGRLRENIGSITQFHTQGIGKNGLHPRELQAWCLGSRISFENWVRRRKSEFRSRTKRQSWKRGPFPLSSFLGVNSVLQTWVLGPFGY